MDNQDLAKACLNAKGCYKCEQSVKSECLQNKCWQEEEVKKRKPPCVYYGLLKSTNGVGICIEDYADDKMLRTLLKKQGIAAEMASPEEIGRALKKEIAERDGIDLLLCREYPKHTYLLYERRVKNGEKNASAFDEYALRRVLARYIGGREEDIHLDYPCVIHVLEN